MNTKIKRSVIGVDVGMRSAGIVAISPEFINGVIIILGKRRDIKGWPVKYQEEGSGVIFFVDDQEEFDKVLTDQVDWLAGFHDVSIGIIEYPYGLKGHATHIYYRCGLVASGLSYLFGTDRLLKLNPSHIRKTLFGNGKMNKKDISRNVEKYFRRYKLPVSLFTRAPEEAKPHLHHLYDACACALYGIKFVDGR